ncbi:MAG: hypothetical protein RL542_426, partial [Bacteroidota bacterium]
TLYSNVITVNSVLDDKYKNSSVLNRRELEE